MKNIIARGVGFAAIGVIMAAFAMSGAVAASAQTGMTYADARSKIADQGRKAVIATVSGDQLELDQCIVASWREDSAVSALGERTGTEILLNLNCNAKVAQPGVPGNSAMTPQGKQAKRDIQVANQINKDPSACYRNDNLAYCKRVCNRTGLCDADAL